MIRPTPVAALAREDSSTVAPPAPNPFPDPPADPPDPAPTDPGGPTPPDPGPGGGPGPPSGGPKGGPEGPVFEFPSGWDLLEDALAGAVESLATGVASLVDTFHYHLLTLPAAGNPADPSTWVPPSDPYWQAALLIYGLLSAFLLPLVWAVGWFNVGYPRGVRRRERLKSLALAFVLIVAGWTLLQAWFHLWNVAALAFAPSGESFMATPGNAAKLGVGVVLGLVLLATKAVVILVGLGIHLLFVFLTFVFVALWPLSVALYASDVFAVETMGTAGIAGTLLLGPLQFVKALVLRLIFEFPLDAGAPETATTFLLVVIGVFLAFVGIPYFGLKRLLPRSIVAAGRRAGRTSTDRVGLRDRAPSGAALRRRVAAVSVPKRPTTSRLGRRDGGAGRGTGSASSTASTRVREGRAPTYQRSRFRDQHVTDTRTRTRSD